MPWPTTDELEILVLRFGRRLLPHAEWTHQAHLSVGTWHVRRYGPDRALARLRRGIRRLNDRHGTPNSDSRGYHETITRAYVLLIAEFLAARPPEKTTAECAQALLASPLAEREALLAYYSKERLMSVAARRDWIEPDRAPLPKRA
jgi:hypothetical protein